MNLSYSCTVTFVEKNKRFSFFPFFFRLVECLFEYIAYIHEPSSEIIFFQEKWKKAGRIVVSKYPTFHLQHHFQISFHSSLRPYQQSTAFLARHQKIDPLDPHREGDSLSTSHDNVT